MPLDHWIPMCSCSASGMKALLLSRSQMGSPRKAGRRKARLTDTVPFWFPQVSLSRSSNAPKQTD